MKVLVADQFSPAGMEEMTNAGMDVTYDAGLKDDALKEKLAEVNPEVLVVRSTKVPPAIVDASSSL